MPRRYLFVPRIPYVIAVALIAVGCSERDSLFRVQSGCMSPSYEPGTLVVARSYKAGGPLNRFDVVIFRLPFEPESLSMMRVVALPREKVTLHHSKVLIDGHVLKSETMPSLLRTQVFLPFNVTNLMNSEVVGTNQVFVLGDNAANAKDSRYWGSLPTSNIVAVVKATKPGK
jgi:signal peptidase I